MNVPCPSCGRDHDLISRTTGDRIWCACGALLAVVHQAGGTSKLFYLSGGKAPASEKPRPRRRKLPA